jgi:hypothetical protein
MSDVGLPAPLVDFPTALRRLSGTRSGCLSLAKLAAVVEPVEGDLSILADLNEGAVGITHVAAPFPAVIVKWLDEKKRSFVAPFLVAGADVGDAQIKEAIYSVQIRRCFGNWICPGRSR